jgi:hypothetical protein
MCPCSPVALLHVRKFGHEDTVHVYIILLTIRVPNFPVSSTDCERPSHHGATPILTMFTYVTGFEINLKKLQQ